MRRRESRTYAHAERICAPARFVLDEFAVATTGTLIAVLQCVAGRPDYSVSVAGDGDVERCGGEWSRCRVYAVASPRTNRPAGAADSAIYQRLRHHADRMMLLPTGVWIEATSRLDRVVRGNKLGSQSSFQIKISWLDSVFCFPFFACIISTGCIPCG